MGILLPFRYISLRQEGIFLVQKHIGGLFSYSRQTFGLSLFSHVVFSLIFLFADETESNMCVLCNRMPPWDLYT